MARFSRKRRPRRKRRRMRRRRFRISNAPLFGKSKRVKFRYCESGQLVPSASDPLKYAVNTWRMNAVNDPSVQQPGAQPEGFSLLRELFHKSFVLGSKITINFLPGNATHSVILYAEKSSTNLATLPSPNLSQILDNRYVNWTMYGSGRGNASRPIVRLKYGTKSWFNVKDVTDNDDLSSRNNSISPPFRSAFYNVSAAPTHAITGPLSPIDYVVVIDFIVQMNEPVNVN